MIKIKYNKITGLLIICCIFSVFLNTIYAEEISVDELNFNIPEGFHKNITNSRHTIDQTGTTSVEVYSNSATDMIIINVLTARNGLKYNLPVNGAGYENRTIKGINGLYNKDINEFIYLYDNKLVSISAHNESLLEEVLIEQ